MTVVHVAWAYRLEPTEAPIVERVYDVYDPPLVVPRTRAFATPDRALVDLPDRRAYRALSRTGLLLAAAGLPARDALATAIDEDPYQVGLYCALDAGPQHYEAARDLIDAGDAFAEGFRKRNHPKRYFTQLVNLPAAHLAIFLGLRGPVNVYSHSTAAGDHALDQATIDLELGVVDRALVATAFSLEDPLLTARVRHHAPTAVVSEGAAALVLRPGPPPDAAPKETGLDAAPHSEACFGIADPIIEQARRGVATLVSR